MPASLNHSCERELQRSVVNTLRYLRHKSFEQLIVADLAEPGGELQFIYQQWGCNDMNF